MNVFVMIFLSLVLLCLIMLVMLWYNNTREETLAINQFMPAWKNDTYKVTPVSNYSTEQIDLKVTFPSNNSSRHFNINNDGKVVSCFAWTGDKITGGHKLGRRARTELEIYTQQIATMHKLLSDSDG